MLGTDEDTIKFEEWANSNISCFSSLSEEEKANLRREYDANKLAKETYSSVMTRAIDTLGGNVDYENDVEKIREKYDSSSENLSQTIESLEEKHQNSRNK